MPWRDRRQAVFLLVRINSSMSAIGTKRTFRVALHMSAFGGKADMPLCAANVAYDPKRT